MRSDRHASTANRNQDSDRPRHEGPDPSLSELEVLQAVSRAFGSSPHLDEASASAVRWVKAAVDTDATVVRLFLVDAEGGLYPIVPRIEVADDSERRAARRQILHRHRPTRTPVAGGRTLVTFPLVSRGESVGVLEVVAPSAAIDERWGTLDAVASQVAIVFRNLAHHASLRSSFEGLQQMSELAGEMVRAHTAQEAVRAAVRFCHERLGRPAAGWLSTADPSRLELVSGRGLGSGGGVRSRMRVLAAHDVRTEQGRRRAAERFAALTGEVQAGVVAAGPALLLVGGSAGATASFRVVEGLLEDVLGHLAVVEAAERRTERLDLGLALTAHEVRGPLVGALAIIERLLMEREEREDEHALLLRSREQLQQLARLVDGMLRWAVAGDPLDLQPTDLVAAVNQAVDGASGESGEDHRVRVTGPKQVRVLADAEHLKVALTNVVRNALAYSPARTQVSVKVAADERVAMVTVRDQGPGVPPAERESIFDPFMRGSAAHLVRTGNGLGLFIARRVMEAHAGRIWLGASRSGASFHLELPLAEEL